MKKTIQRRLREARYALQCFEQENLGGEVQSIAAMQFLPSIDLLIERDRIGRSAAAVAEPHKIILNGWFTDRPEDWPPAAFLEPLITSFHLSREVSARNLGGLVPAETLLQGESLEYLIQHEPIGARDLSTRELLLEAGVEAYFSGCLSLTLGDGAPAERGDYVCAVDLPARLLRRLRSQVVSSRLVVGTHEDATHRSFGERAHLARRMLSRYAHAKCVVTTRLHCALPCLALGTPVLLIMSAKDKYRFSGLSDLLHICLPQAFLDGTAGFKPDDPPDSSERFLTLRNDLIANVGQFVGLGPESVGTAPFPFVPDPLTDALLAPDQIQPPTETGVDPSGAAFHRLFKLGRSYDGEARPDFLRDLGRVHAAGGDMDEAARLLAIASRERPHGAQIRNLLDQFKAKRPEPGGPETAPHKAQTNLSPLAQEVLARGLTQLSPQQLASLCEQLSRVRARGVPGDFVTCGVALGGAAICIAGQLDGARKFLGFDVFETSPGPEGERAVEPGGDVDGTLGDTLQRSQANLRDVAAANLASFGLRVDDRRIRLSHGRLQDTLAEGLTSPIAFAHIECDQDDSVTYCLQRVDERLSRFGAMIVTGYDERAGRRTAVDAFRSGREDIALVATQPHAILIKL